MDSNNELIDWLLRYLAFSFNYRTGKSGGHFLKIFV